MDENSLSQLLRAEGFVNAYVWQDDPDAFHPDHTHVGDSAHIVLAGEMSLTINGQTRTYRSGERCDVAAGTTHSARIGLRGCRYLIGEK
jgi:quercetin dioxygenase-like cupin family protein